MIRSATKEDGQAIARLVLVILKDMELPILEEVSEEQMIDLLAEATAYPTYRYGYQRILVYEHVKLQGLLSAILRKMKRLLMNL